MDSSSGGKNKEKKRDSDEMKNKESFIFNRNNLLIDKDYPVIKEDSKES